MSPVTDMAHYRLGYARMSTLQQDEALQHDALYGAGCARIFVDTASGKRESRPALDALLEQARPGDTLVVWRLDRLGRSLRHLIETVADLEQRGVAFMSLTENINTSTPGGRLVFHVFGALAEFERDRIRERTAAGLAAARARGRVGGRPTVWTAEKRRTATRCCSPVSTTSPASRGCSVSAGRRCTEHCRSAARLDTPRPPSPATAPEDGGAESFLHSGSVRGSSTSRSSSSCAALNGAQGEHRGGERRQGDHVLRGAQRHEQPAARARRLVRTEAVERALQTGQPQAGDGQDAEQPVPSGSRGPDPASGARHHQDHGQDRQPGPEEREPEAERPARVRGQPGALATGRATAAAAGGDGGGAGQVISYTPAVR